MGLTTPAQQEAQQSLFEIEESRKPCSTCGRQFPHCQFDGCPTDSKVAKCNGHWMSCRLTSEGQPDPTYRPKHRVVNPELDTP